jgi:predicted nucleic acid-binding protein
MKQIIADSSGLYAVVDRKDPNHEVAKRFLNSLAPGAVSADGVALLISNHVFDEVMTLTKRRLGPAVALQLGLRLRNSRFTEMVVFSEALEQELWRTFHRYSDKAWSYTDCACLVLAQNRKVSLAFSFDHHFAQMGLTIQP